MRCSVVFGLLSKHVVVFSRNQHRRFYYQRSVTLNLWYGRGPPATVLITLACGSVNSSQKPDIGSESRFLPIPPAFDSPVGGGSRRNFAMAFCKKKTRMVWLPDGEKKLMICLFVLTELTNVTDTQTVRHRMTT